MRVFNPFPTLKRELSVKTILVLLLIAFFYSATSLYALNYRFVLQSLNNSLPFNYKIWVLRDMLLGIGTALPTYELVLLLITSVLVGLNLALLLKEIRKLRKQGGIKLSAGSLLVSGVGIGCPSCSITLLSFLGPSTSIVLLPYQTMTLQVVAIGFLLFSLYTMMKNVYLATCQIPARRLRKS